MTQTPCTCKHCLHPEIPGCLCCGESQEDKLLMYEQNPGEYSEYLCLTCQAAIDGPGRPMTGTALLSSLGPLELTADSLGSPHDNTWKKRSAPSAEG